MKIGYCVVIDNYVYDDTACRYYDDWIVLIAVGMSWIHSK